MLLYVECDNVNKYLYVLNGVVYCLCLLLSFIFIKYVIFKIF